MTLTQANSIFQKKYPTGEIFAHGFSDGSAESTCIQRTCLCFKKGGKVYSYRDSYENTLVRLGLYEKQVDRYWDNDDDDNDDDFAELFE